MKYLSCLILLGLPVFAASITLDASGFPSGNYIFDFQFINGDQIAGNNSAMVSGFAATGVTLTSLQTFGTLTGASLAGGLTMIDGPVTEVQEAFTSGGSPWSIGFDISYTGNYSGPGPGDAFTFTITDTSLNPINSSGDGSLLEADIIGPDAPINTFPADPAFGSIEPQVVSAVPEPSTVGSLCLGLLLIVRLRRIRFI